MVAQLYGQATYGGLLPASVTGGVVTVDAVCYRATAANAFLDVVPVAKGEVVVDLGAQVPMTFTGELLGADLLTPFRDWLAPVITIERPSADGTGNVIETQQLGLYQVQPARKTYTAASSRFAIDGRDPTWLLGSHVFARPYNVPAATNYSEALRDLCDLVGVRHAIQSTTKVTPRIRSWKPGETALQAFNDLARSNGFLAAFPDRIGRVRSHRFQRLQQPEPARTISSAAGDVIRTVSIDPDPSRLCNHVIVVGNNPDGDLIVAERLNNDPRSPTSTVRIGTPDQPAVITKYVEDSNIEDQDAADDLADRLMDQGASANVRMELTTLPIASWMPHDISLLAVVNDAGEEVAAGRWRWTGLRMGFGAQGRTTWTMEKLLPWAQVA